MRGTQAAFPLSHPPRSQGDLQLELSEQKHVHEVPDTAGELKVDSHVYGPGNS